MAGKGKRQYQCTDCGELRFVHWVELNRAAVPRCYGCGGTLEPHSSGAKEDRLIGNRNRAGATSDGSVTLPSRAELNPHHKVT